MQILKYAVTKIYNKRNESVHNMSDDLGFLLLSMLYPKDKTKIIICLRRTDHLQQIAYQKSITAGLTHLQLKFKLATLPCFSNTAPN